MIFSIDKFNGFAKSLQASGMYDKTVVHLNGSQDGYSTTMWQRIGCRTDEFKQQNRLIRQQLVDGLRTAFGGVSLDKLPKSIRDALNISSFGIDADGNAQSERPLTARRIIAISKAIVEWQETCRKVSESVAESPMFLNQPDARKAEDRLYSLFDRKRPLPANLSQATLEKAAKSMIIMNLKPYQVRLALECVSKVLAERISVPSGKTSVDRLVKLSKEIGGAVGLMLSEYNTMANAFMLEHRNDNPPPPSNYIRDGVSRDGIADVDMTDIHHLMLMLLKDDLPGLSGLLDSVRPKEVSQLIDIQGELSDEANKFVFKRSEVLDQIRDIAETDSKRRLVLNARAKELYGRECAGKASSSVIENFFRILSERHVVFENIDFENQRAFPVNKINYRSVVEGFNASDPRDFSLDRMFVRNGRQGTRGFDENVDTMFRGMDQRRFVDRTRQISSSIANLAILEEMSVQLRNHRICDSDFEKDMDREVLMNSKGDRLSRNLNEANDEFASQLRRKPGAKYSDLTEVEKRKIMLMKSMLHQKVEVIPFFSVTAASSPNGDSFRINSMLVSGNPDSSDNLIRYSFDDDGGMTVSLFRMIRGGDSLGLGFDAEGNENGEVETTKPILTKTRIDLHIPPEEVERLAGLDWSKLKIDGIKDAYDAQTEHPQPSPDFFADFKQNHIPEQFRINVETSVHVSYEITD